MRIKIQNEDLVLSAERVVIWEKERTLFLADLHLGKTTHFRKAGIAVPEKLIFAEIARIKSLIIKYHPRSIFFLGDLFHSRLNVEWTLFTALLNEFPSVKFTLIKGNHDILPERSYLLPNLSCEEEPFILKNFLLSHHPLSKEEIDELGDYTNLAGHLHPGIFMNGKAKTSIKLPCFHLRKKQIIFPAFGIFTGLAQVIPTKEDRIFAVARQEVLEIKQTFKT